MTAAIYARIALAVLCWLLAGATAASAECAWVSWLGTGTTYTPFGAYGGNTGEKGCKEAATQLMTRHEQRCETTRRVSQVKWSVSLPPRHRGAAWAEGDEMIAATYARKSNKQQGVADEPRAEVA